MKKILKVLFIFIFLFTLASCSSKQANYDNGSKSYNNDLVYSTDRSVIYKVRYNHWSKEYKKEIKEVREYVVNVSGYIESSNDYDTYAYYTYRIPTDKLNDFMKFIDEREGYKDMSTSTTDVTTTYNYVGDVLTDLSNRKAQYEAMLENTDLTLDERLSIENQIDKLRTEIIDYESRAVEQQEDLEYATVNINYHLKTNQFVDFILNVLLFVGVMAIIFIPFGTAGLIVFLVLRKKKNNKIKEA